ncbi:Fic family protein [Rhizosphaericola mali]|uniref:Fic family protein n=1 Tax=Rhizosphaericola mali TaxID=2545455 RepID=A0A5P2G316_9BACT|nr:Fic family protein [Rhizosphaericola mali]QES90214.1 Fic family protein [Rhizosphaericola mali]
MIQVENFQSGQFSQGLKYKYFVPTYIDDQWHWDDPVINDLNEKAAMKLGELNAFSRFVPNIDLFIQLHVTKEAVVSSKIEGTQTNMDEALLPESEINPERRNDWKEVNNYIKAMNVAIDDLKSLPLSGRLLRNIHAILLDSVRGEFKTPGAYRRSQNWIGGASLADARFIPPHHDLVHDLMGDLEKFLHNDEIHMPELVRIAIAHYQFETIHPFLDGNGRIGRLLITLYLVSRDILDKPLLYLSTFFEKEKSLYYSNLTNVREQHDMCQWIKYFLIGIEKTATQAVDTLKEVLDLKVQKEEIIHSQFGRRISSASKLLNELFIHPIITVEEAKKITQLSYKATNDLITVMIQHSILREITGQSRNRIFVFDAYLTAFNN